MTIRSATSSLALSREIVEDFKVFRILLGSSLVKKFVIVIPLIGAACSAPETLFSSSSSITFNNVTNSKMSEVTSDAEKHCARFNKIADFESFNKALGVVEFNCVDG